MRNRYALELCNIVLEELVDWPEPYKAPSKASLERLEKAASELEEMGEHQVAGKIRGFCGRVEKIMTRSGANDGK